VRLNYDVSEGPRSRVGRITIRGNVRTQERVVRRELRFYPGEDFNTVKAREAEQRILETGLFDRATITALGDINGEREALVEVEPARQVDFLVGLGVSTDSGVLGSLNINNRNFDLFDWPRTWGEFFRGQSFRGAGQRLRLELEPGNKVSRFRIAFTEPYLLDKPVRLDTSLYLFQRQRESYDEERLGFVLSLGRRFESGLLNGWAIEGSGRFENVKIDNLRTLASTDIRESRGNSFLTSLKFAIVRDTTDSRLMPSRGYRASFSWEQVGALGGDVSFSKPVASVAWYKTLRTDVLDRRSILAARADAGFIAGDAPVFERFFGGGFGSIRGFDFQGVSPRQGLFNDRIGGDFVLLLGGEYSVPLYAKNIRGVAFLDMGTVEEDFEITDWRAAVGVGLRINVNFFGPVPIVLDWGFPISSNDDDDTRVFNFSFGASF
jgi:outer membrane protein assembly factor BamA